MKHGQGSKFKKANNKGKGTNLEPKRVVSKKLKFKENASTVRNKVTNVHIVDYQTGINPKKPMWLMTSVRVSLTLTSQR